MQTTCKNFNCFFQLLSVFAPNQRTSIIESRLVSKRTKGMDTFGVGMSFSISRKYSSFALYSRCVQIHITRIAAMISASFSTFVPSDSNILLNTKVYLRCCFYCRIGGRGQQRTATKCVWWKEDGIHSSGYHGPIGLYSISTRKTIHKILDNIKMKESVVSKEPINSITIQFYEIYKKLSKWFVDLIHVACFVVPRGDLLEMRERRCLMLDIIRCI